MKKALLEEFKGILKKKYIFHLHTNHTDGKSTVEDYCLWAQDHGYEAVVFTEHVRKKLLYNFSSFLNDIENAKQKFPNLNILIGVEVKILPGGDLDLSGKILDYCQILCFACHSFPKNIELFKKSLKKVFVDNRWKDFVRVWMHPSILSINLNIKNDQLLKELIFFAIKEEVFIEYNLKYNTLPKHIIRDLQGLCIIQGLDAHSVEDLKSLV